MQRILIQTEIKRIALSLFVCIQAIFSQAQVPDLASVGSMYTRTDEGGMCLDASGNLYVVGAFWSTVDFDMGPDSTKLTSAGSQDIFIQKLDASGNLLWVKSIGGTGEQSGRAVACDAKGNIYFTGHFFGNNIDFDPGTGVHSLSAANADIFVCKLDSSGDFLWAKKMGGADDDRGYAIAVDYFGAVYTTGYYEGTVDFDPGSAVNNLTSLSWNSGLEVFIQKLDANGNFQWAKRIASATVDVGRSITVDLSGNVYTAGSFGGSADFDPSSGTFSPAFNGGEDAFVQKLTTNGDFLWARTWGGTSFEACSEIKIDASGNVYTTGHYQQSVDFNTGSDTLMITSNGYRDIFIHKLDSSGNFLWVKSIGAQNYDAGTGLTVDPNADVYTTGWFRNNPDFDPGSATNLLSSNGGTIDAYVLKMDSSGNYVWAFSLGGPDGDDATKIVTNGNGDTYVLGSYEGTVDFDPGSGTSYLTSLGTSKNMFILQLDECVTNYATHHISTCSSYTWVDGITYSANTTTPKDTLINHKGCDSIVTLHLTISVPTTSIYTVSACDSFKWKNNITYYASNNTAKDTFVNSKGCDSIVTLNLTIRNSSKFTDTVIACDSFTWINGIRYTASTSNTVKHTLINASGCDSVVTLNLTILNSNAAQHTVTACDSFNWINGTTYTSSTSNTVKHTLSNASGCDSVVTLNLTILHSNSAIHKVESCDSFVWISGITYYSSNSTASHVLTNRFGCDSLVYLNLRINYSTQVTDIVNACREYTWINGINYTSNTQGVSHFLTTDAGCDSMVVLDLTIHDVSTSTTTGGTTIQANEANASYQWLDCGNNFGLIAGANQQAFTPTVRGNYAVEISTNYCIDTSACVSFTGVGLAKTAFAESIRLYPNPTTRHVTLSFEESYPSVKIRIVDATGKLIEESIGRNMLEVELELKGAAGVYFIELESEQDRAVFMVYKY